VEKLEKLVCSARFNDKFQFGDLGSGTFQIHFEASNGILGVKNLLA
jgi:hypothetical protein